MLSFNELVFGELHVTSVHHCIFTHNMLMLMPHLSHGIYTSYLYLVSAYIKSYNSDHFILIQAESLKFAIMLLGMDCLWICGYFVTCLVAQQQLLCLCVDKLALQAIKEKVRSAPSVSVVIVSSPIFLFK